MRRRTRATGKKNDEVTEANLLSSALRQQKVEWLHEHGRPAQTAARGHFWCICCQLWSRVERVTTVWLAAALCWLLGLRHRSRRRRRRAALLCSVSCALSRIGSCSVRTAHVFARIAMVPVLSQDREERVRPQTTRHPPGLGYETHSSWRRQKMI
jgi:hypothetical protein